MCGHAIVCGINKFKKKVYLEVNISWREHQVCRSASAYIFFIFRSSLTAKLADNTNYWSTRCVILQLGEMIVGSLSTKAEFKATTYGGWMGPGSLLDQMPPCMSSPVHPFNHVIWSILERKPLRILLKSSSCASIQCHYQWQPEPLWFHHLPILFFQ